YGQFGRHSSHLERKICFDSGAQVARRIIIDTPGAIVALVVEEVGSNLRPALRVSDAQEVREEEIFSRNGDIRFQFTPPPALWRLRFEQVCLRARDGRSDGFLLVVGW